MKLLRRRITLAIYLFISRSLQRVRRSLIAQAIAPTQVHMELVRKEAVLEGFRKVQIQITQAQAQLVEDLSKCMVYNAYVYACISKSRIHGPKIIKYFYYALIATPLLPGPCILDNISKTVVTKCFFFTDIPVCSCPDDGPSRTWIPASLLIWNHYLKIF